jgi:hypothetical protein
MFELSHSLHCASELYPALTASYSPSLHFVMAVHSRFVFPMAGALDSYSSSPHTSVVPQTKLLTFVAASTTCSLKAHDVAARSHRVFLCDACDWNLPSSHATHVFVRQSSFSPAPQFTGVDDVVDVVVVVVVVAVPVMVVAVCVVPVLVVCVTDVTVVCVVAVVVEVLARCTTLYR